jgi:hypothetical protein
LAAEKYYYTNRLEQYQNMLFKDAENDFAPLMMVSIEALKRTLAGISSSGID